MYNANRVQKDYRKLSKAERRKRRRATPKYRNLHATRERFLDLKPSKTTSPEVLIKLEPNSYNNSSRGMRNASPMCKSRKSDKSRIVQHGFCATSLLAADVACGEETVEN
ncbi:hypothetical protein TELCIR_01753 [Teladorsagia circumcincta]|uniref:Uncharacterized protein n=1 Tax=Teladorsagia circumcincta TaxID=45464 RepID=A0A2G9V130_TELCI|nr:hypothetical protein TELCIR_01753 [Teladorsagia circumcincta]